MFISVWRLQSFPTDPVCFVVSAFHDSQSEMWHLADRTRPKLCALGGCCSHVTAEIRANVFFAATHSSHQAGGVGLMAQWAAMASVICSQAPDIYPSHPVVGADTCFPDCCNIWLLTKWFGAAPDPRAFTAFWSSRCSRSWLKLALPWLIT